MPVAPAALAAWHLAPGALERLLPPFAAVRVERPGAVAEGSEVVLRMGPGPLALRWVARHRDVEPGRGFVDEQVSGPFARFVHTHRFLAEGDHAVLEDAIEWRLRDGPLLHRLAGGRVRRSLERGFRFRHRRTRDDLRRQQSFAEAPRLRVAVTGATGLVGSALGAFLGTAGHRVQRVTRRPVPGRDDIGWSPREGRLDAAALDGVDAVVNLAGEPLFALRWSERKRRAIRASRVDGTGLLARTLAGLSRPPRVLITASAIGWYGDRGGETLTEADAAGSGFLADVCREWEAAADAAEKAGIRVVRLRIGVVLSARGGALATMLPAFSLGLGGRLGSGEQQLSWIALDDLVGAIHFCLQRDDVVGAVNATAPEPTPNADFTRTLARVLGRPALLPAPRFALRGLLGDMADEMLLASARVEPAALARAGYEFRLGALEDALRFELGRLRGGPAFEHTN